MNSNNDDLIFDIFFRVRSAFTWKSDQSTFGQNEHWTSHADAIERGENIQDDCDSFAMTCAELAMRAGISKQDILLATCHVETGEYHAVAFVDKYVLDNRKRQPVIWTSLPYQWDRSMRLSELGTWRTMKTTGENNQ